MDRIIRNLGNRKNTKSDDVAYLIILQSRRCPYCYWIYTFIQTNFVNCSFWWGTDISQCSSIQVQYSSLIRKYMSGLWVPILISRISRELSVIPYEYHVAFHPNELLQLHLNGHMIVWSMNRPELSVQKLKNHEHHMGEAVIRSWQSQIPFILYTKRMKRIQLDIESLPPLWNGKFLGGILYQQGAFRFNSLKSGF